MEDRIIENYFRIDKHRAVFVAEDSMPLGNLIGKVVSFDIIKRVPVTGTTCSCIICACNDSDALENKMSQLWEYMTTCGDNFEIYENVCDYVSYLFKTKPEFFAELEKMSSLD